MFYIFKNKKCNKTFSNHEWIVSGTLWYFCCSSNFFPDKVKHLFIQPARLAPVCLKKFMKTTLMYRSWHGFRSTWYSALHLTWFFFFSWEADSWSRVVTACLHRWFVHRGYNTENSCWRVLYPNQVLSYAADSHQKALATRLESVWHVCCVVASRNHCHAFTMFDKAHGSSNFAPGTIVIQNHVFAVDFSYCAMACFGYA